MNPQKFAYKTYGRIFVQKEEDIALVKAIMQDLDEFEYEYLPSDLITVWTPNSGMVYLHKFEMDKIALTEKCIMAGIWIWCVDNQPEY